MGTNTRYENADGIGREDFQPITMRKAKKLSAEQWQECTTCSKKIQSDNDCCTDCQEDIDTGILPSYGELHSDLQIAREGLEDIYSRGKNITDMAIAEETLSKLSTLNGDSCEHAWTEDSTNCMWCGKSRITTTFSPTPNGDSPNEA